MSEVLKQNIMKQVLDTSISEELVAEILQYLENIKLDIYEVDFYIIAFAIKKVHSEIKNILNVSVIPTEVENIIIQRVCGEVLHTKYIRNELPENLSDETIIKNISLGDSTVSYDTSQSENKILSLINSLKRAGEGELLCYRKLTW